MNTHTRKNRSKRSGIILVVVLACLSVVVALTLAALQTALRMRREVRTQHLVSQASVLCEAGVVRAANRLQQNEYRGETWSPVMPELPNKQAHVTISLIERGGPETTVQVEAVIQDPTNKHNRVQRSLIVTLASQSIPESSQGESP